jgi:hypothetical protein
MRFTFNEGINKVYVTLKTARQQRRFDNKSTPMHAEKHFRSAVL